MTGKVSIDFLILTQLLIQRRGHPVPKDRTAISGDEEEPLRNNWGNKSDDGQPDLENETEAEMDVSLEKYARQGRANTRIPRKTYQMISYEELDEPRDNNRSQQSSQFEREADPHSQDGSYTEFRRNQSVDDTRESNKYHDTDDYDTRDNTNSPRVIGYRDMNRDTQSRNNNSQYGGGTQPILEVIEGKIIAPPTQQINFMRILEKMRAILEFLTIRISIRMIGVSIQISATTDTPMIQTWVGNKTGHQTALHLDKIKAFISLVADKMLLQ